MQNEHPVSWLTQCYGCNKFVSLDDLLVVISQPDASQAKKCPVPRMLRPNVDSLITLLTIRVSVAI